MTCYPSYTLMFFLVRGISPEKSLKDVFEVKYLLECHFFCTYGDFYGKIAIMKNIRIILKQEKLI